MGAILRLVSAYPCDDEIHTTATDDVICGMRTLRFSLLRPLNRHHRQIQLHAIALMMIVSFDFAAFRA